jgi:hypothetical protein
MIYTAEIDGETYSYESERKIGDTVKINYDDERNDPKYHDADWEILNVRVMRSGLKFQVCPVGHFGAAMWIKVNDIR